MPLAQLETMSPCTVAGSLGEEIDPHLATPSCHGVVESGKVTPEPPFLQVNH